MTRLCAGAIADSAAVGLVADRGAFWCCEGTCAGPVLLAAAAVVAASRRPRRSLN